MKTNHEIFKIEELEERLEMTSMEALGDNVICWKPNEPEPKKPVDTAPAPAPTTTTPK